ncbi:MAG: 16S rRNA (guanine(966)-N(2))-methyltransferase RsmD [Oscillospiraceae bacterium]|nr:16S rRNA (guanine(966)-N(2))-methyltransferase RsmD [Oscillospiraceae bacterium]
MRVIGGAARGRKLREPAGMDVRPTTDKVKESLFNIVQFDVEGARVLDMFAGTGQLGIEALSRGAAEAVFLEASPVSARIVAENLRLTGFSDRARLIRGDALRTAESAGRFDLIFIDPPYDSELAKQAVERIIAFDILKENGIMICETRVDYNTPEASWPYEKLKEYRYGRIKLTKYGRAPAEE